MTRLFVGIEMPDWVVAELARLAGGIPGARWVDPDNLHLTLRFIGEVDGFQYDQIDAALSGLVGESFTMTLQGVGHFHRGGRQKPCGWGWKVMSP